MKFSNILKAYKSTLLGIAITVTTSLAQALTAGPINWGVIGASAGATVLLALTDILKEEQKKG
jgi:hypothetical protein